MKIGLEAAERETYDLCIVGAGPAGIILALEYARLQPKHRILLIEYGAGGKEVRNKLDDTIRVEGLLNHHGPYECTNKGIGGTSASWGGRCVMYDEIDFMQREILEGQCTWDVALFKESLKFANPAA